MKFSDIRESIVRQFSQPFGHRINILVEGEPGGGKSDLGRAAFSDIGIPPERVLEFNASLRDPTDILGIPFKSDDGTHSLWLPPEEMWKMRRGTGKWGLLLEEYSDAQMAMQNGLCRVMHDRHAGQLQLTDELYVIGTGNRTEDKSGAQRVSTKFYNRGRLYTLEANIDDWSEWALMSGIDTVLIQFLRFRPALLSQFDPNRKVNPTPRKWGKDVANIPTDMSSGLYLGAVSGDVGEGPAAEYIGFRHIYENLPNLDALLLNPSRAEVPTDVAVLYALGGALATRSTKDNFDRVWEFVQRMPPDFQVMTVCDAMKLKPEVRNTKGFVSFATKNSNLVL